MTEGKLAILSAQGRRLVASQSGGSIPPGLALTLVPLVPEWGDAQRGKCVRWSITHSASGKRVGPGFTDREDAQRVAEALADCADWTLPEFALLALPNITETVAAALDAALTELYGLTPTGDPS